MLRLALIGEQTPLHQHIPHQSHNCEGRAEVLAEAAILPCRRPYLPPHPVHDVPGGTKKHCVIPLVIYVARVVARVVVVVVVDDSGVIVDDVTHLTHRWAFLVVDGGGLWSGGCRGSHFCFFLLACVV